MKRALQVLGCLWAASGVLAAAPQGVAPAQELKLTVGRGTVLDLHSDVGRVSISNPEVVDAVAASTRELLLNAKAQGMATVVVWSKSGERAVYSVAVEQNLEPVRKLLAETFPEEDIRVQAARDSLSLSGTVSAQAVGERAAALLVPFAKAVVNNLKVAPPGPEKQIVLRVKFAELNRTAASSFGVNLVSTGAANTPGTITTGQFSAARPAKLSGIIGAPVPGTKSEFEISDVLNVFAFRPDLNLSAFIKALQTRGLLQILAEPNLVATNGKEASFLVGGEFPIPVVQGGANAGAITILFKEFGIRLTFLPNLTAHGSIRMHVKPEVSTIDLTNAVVFSGFTIPALATRRMETDVELGLGQSFVIAGLIDDRTNEMLMKIPGLAHIPILGALFRSRQQNKTKTELIVMVTPELSVPGSPPIEPNLPEQKLPPVLLAPPAREPGAGKPGQ